MSAILTIWVTVLSVYTAQASLESDFLAAHNKYRRMEPASNMIEMTWSAEVAANAQMHADRCMFAHTGEPERTNVGGFDYLGENLWMRHGSQEYDADSIVKAWHDEKADYTMKSLTCAPKRACGHYTQVVWAETSTVGCGVALCPENEVIAVCQYGPGGNYIGEAPYKSGTACSECPDGYTACNDKLCKKAQKRSLFSSPLFRIRALADLKRSGVL